MSDFISTSRLSNALGLDSKLLFQWLHEQKWISREGEKWLLTAQGEYHGGKYQHSDKYGDYVVWPASLAEHPLLTDIDGSWVSATRIAEKAGLTAHTVNLLLSELGWIEKDQRGWMLSELGKKLGGEARSVKKGFYVMWPSHIRQNPVLMNALDNVSAVTVGKSLDGHSCSAAAQQKICNWLYLNGLTHAVDRLVAGQDDWRADFYLPQRKVYIDFWDVNNSQLPLSVRLQKQDYYQSKGLKVIELNQDDLSCLDDVLPQRLLQFGVQLY